jgi:hypothetical protein
MVNKLLLAKPPAAKKAVKVALKKKRSLVAMKKASMRLARSSVSAAGSQEDFGLIPRGMSLQVVAWPEL